MLSPEDKLILSAVKLHPTTEELEQMNDLIPQIQRWDYLAATSIDRGIAPLLYKKLPLLSNSGLVPEQVKSKLQQAYFKTFSRSMVLYEHFRKVTEAFASHNIPVIALKGIYLSEWLYKDIGLRQFSDIDLLVKPEDGEKCLDILSKLGFKSTFSDKEESKFIISQSDIVHYRPRILKGVSIELHIKLHSDNEKYHLGIDELWKNAQPAIINNNCVFVLGTNDLIIHLCVHLDKHFRSGHVQFTCFNDITNLLEKHAQTMDWNSFIEASRLYHCENIVFEYIVLVNKYMKATVPINIIEKYSHLLTDKDERLFRKYIKGYTFSVYANTVPTHFEELNNKSFSMQIRYIKENLFPSKAFMITKYEIKKPSFVFFYYPYRYYIGLKGLVKLVFSR